VQLAAFFTDQVISLAAVCCTLEKDRLILLSGMVGLFLFHWILGLVPLVPTALQGIRFAVSLIL
jgi:hypothetical protein